MTGITWNTPWKINMDPTKHPFREENDLPNLHDYVPCSWHAFCKRTLGPPPKPSRIDKLILFMSKSTDSIRTFTSLEAHTTVPGKESHQTMRISIVVRIVQCAKVSNLLLRWYEQVLNTYQIHMYTCIQVMSELDLISQQTQVMIVRSPIDHSISDIC